MGDEAATGAGEALVRRVERYDWPAVERQLDDLGYARLPALLRTAECKRLARLYGRDDAFRKTIDMRRHAYGEGQYRYLAYPLPKEVATLRAALYGPLRAIANRWNEELGIETRYPDSPAEFSSRCRQAGQERPTPLLLRYTAGGYNRMHQDVYGDVAFPLQVACVLSPDEGSSETGYRGGEFLVSESRPRMQTRTTAVRLETGEGIVFANAVRPVVSARGHARAAMRHGVSTVLSGERIALGIIFHDAA